MAKKVVRYKLVKHKWPDEIAAEKKARKRKFITVAACLVFFVGGYASSFVLNPSSVSTMNNEEFDKFFKIYNIMNTKFYFGKDKEDFSDTLINGAIAGMVNAGDDKHTSYLDAEKTESFTSSMEGSFVGIGVQYYQLSEGVYIIDKVFKDSPAEEAGVMQGDQIFAIDGKAVKELSIDDVANLIKGSEKSMVHMEVIRENKHVEMDVERREVQSSTTSEVKGTTGILTLTTFADTSGEEVGKHLKDLQAAGCKTLILDLRDNGGGYLVAAQEIASYLLPQDTVAFKEKDADGKISDYKTKDGYTQYKFDKVVVLVNDGTASAAEVLTTALQEQINAVTVGINTYGKGTAQIPLPFKDGSMLKYTTNEWLTSKGNSINGKGIAPDYEVTLDEAITTGAPKLEEDEVYEADSVNIAAKSVQIYLKFLGYPVDRTDPYFSNASSAALKQYQQDKGLQADGKISAEVVNSLLSSCSLKWHKEQDTLDLQMKKAMAIVNGN